MPENSIMQLYVPAKDYEAHDEHRNTIAAKSEAVGVKPFAPLGEDCGALYLRTDIRAALRKS